MSFERTHGNYYTLTFTDFGVPTFAHHQTGQLLHSHIGPYQEAWKLYVKNSGILSWEGECVVYDLGLGCASQVIAMRDAFFQNKKITRLHIVSFDLETHGIQALLEHLEHFPFAQPHESFLRKAIKADEVTEHFSDERTLTWNFVRGDYSKTIFDTKIPHADIVCYDFFSVSAHPYLWTFRLFDALAKRCSENCFILTYSSATSVRAALLAAGFFVGFSPDKEEVFRMTVAAKDREKIIFPLDERWLQKFKRSSLPYVSIEPEETKELIRKSVFEHPQFQNC